LPKAGAGAWAETLPKAGAGAAAQALPRAGVRVAAQALPRAEPLAKAGLLREPGRVDRGSVTRLFSMPGRLRRPAPVPFKHPPTMAYEVKTSTAVGGSTAGTSPVPRTSTSMTPHGGV
jgi:hypothetical protein